MTLEKKVLHKEEKKGTQFWPHQVAVEAVAMIVVLGVLLAMAIFWVPPHETVARPSDTSFVPRPEWYFLFLFEMLRFFPGELEVLGVVVIPGIVILALLLLPFFDTGKERRPWRRPVTSAAAVVGLVFMVYMTNNALSGTPHSITSPAELVRMGQEQYVKQECAACHAINGTGGRVGPDLAGLEKNLTLSYVHRYIENPAAVNAASQMPGFVGALSQDEIAGISLYLMGLKKEALPAVGATAPETPAPQVTPGSETPAPAGQATPAPVAGGAPLITHSLAGREGMCLTCHKTGIGGAPKVPDFHTAGSFTNDMCLGCHKPAV